MIKILVTLALPGASDNELVGGAITILKNMKVNGKDYPIYYGQ